MKKYIPILIGGILAATFSYGAVVDFFNPGVGGLVNNFFYFDNTNNRFGIATSVPGTLFSINNSVNFVSSGTSTIYSPLGIGTTSAASMFSVSTTTATTTVHIGGQSTVFGSCIQMYAASGTPYRMYISGDRPSANGDQLRVEKGGCADPKPRP